MERKKRIKLNIIACVFILIVFTASLIVYFVKKPKNKVEIEAPYILVNGSGDDAYTHGLLLPKGITVKEIVDKLKIHTGNIQEIYIHDRVAWKKVELNQRIYKSSTFKLKY